MHRGLSSILSHTENQRLWGHSEYLLQSISIRCFKTIFYNISIQRVRLDNQELVFVSILTL